MAKAQWSGWKKCVSSIAIGDRAQGFSKVSRDNIAIGPDSLINVQAETEWYDQSKIAGTRNIGIGGNAGRAITSGFSNVAIGRNAGQGLGVGSSNIALGAGAMAGTAPVGLSGDIEVFWPSQTSKTIAIGEAVLQSYQGRSAQTAIGGSAARNTKMAEKVTVIGAAAMENLERNRAPNGGDVVWMGTEVGTYAQSGKSITLTFPNIRGAQATYWVGIRLTSGTAQTLQNDVVPAQVVSVNGNTFTIQSSKELTATGAAELKYVYSANSAATKNEELTIIGSNTMNKALTAGYSTIIGADAALTGENYQKTTAIGASSLRTGTHISTTAIGYWTIPTASSEQCVVIGDSAGYRNVQGDILKGKITNSIAIGYGARINGDNEIQIGTNGQTLYAPTAVNIRSDGRDKTDIKPLSDGLKFVMKLKPVTGYYDRRDAYVDELFADFPEEERAVKVREWWKNPTKDGRHKEDRLQHWFIAQDIAALEDEYGRLPMVNEKNDTYTIEYETFIPVLTKAIQEMAARIETLETEIKELKKMTRCVIDSDGLFVEEQYFDDGRQSIEAELPTLKEFQAARWTGEKWEIIPDYRGVLVFTKDGEQIWQQIGNLPDGVSLTPPESANIDGVKSGKLVALNAAAQAFINKHAGIDSVPEFEFASWSIQASEAKAWQLNKNAPTPVLDGIATARGIPADTLKSAALRKTLAYEQLAAHVAGQRQALQSKIEAAKKQSDLNKIEITFSLPEAV